MEINNLSSRDRKVADLIWAANTKEDLEAVLRNLSRKDQLRAAAITYLAIAGGDAVEDVAEAQQYLKRFQIG